MVSMAKSKTRNR